MRILHVSHQYPPAIGGAERYVANLSEESAARGHEVDVFTCRSLDYHAWKSELPGFERVNGVNVYRFRAIRRREYTWRLLRYGVWKYWPQRRMRYEPFIWVGNGPICPGMFLQILRNRPKYDLMHLNSLHYAHASLAYTAASLCGIPTVVSPLVHAEQPVTYDVGYIRRLVENSTHTFVLTANEKEFLLEQRMKEAQAITVGGVGLHLSEYPAQDRAKSRDMLGVPQNGTVLLFLGRKVTYKGLAEVLKAFGQLRHTRDALYLLAVGPETDESRLLWKEVGQIDGVINHDAVSADQKLAALAACDIFVLPSVGESFGIVFVEAWAYRKPVIGARINAVESLIDDGVNGLLIEPGNHEQLADHIAKLIDEPAYAATVGENGYQTLLSRYTFRR